MRVIFAVDCHDDAFAAQRTLLQDSGNGPYSLDRRRQLSKLHCLNQAGIVERRERSTLHPSGTRCTLVRVAPYVRCCLRRPNDDCTDVRLSGTRVRVREYRRQSTQPGPTGLFLTHGLMPARTQPHMQSRRGTLRASGSLAGTYAVTYQYRSTRSTTSRKRGTGRPARPNHLHEDLAEPQVRLLRKASDVAVRTPPLLRRRMLRLPVVAAAAALLAALVAVIALKVREGGGKMRHGYGAGLTSGRCGAYFIELLFRAAHVFVIVIVIVFVLLDCGV